MLPNKCARPKAALQNPQILDGVFGNEAKNGLLALNRMTLIFCFRPKTFLLLFVSNMKFVTNKQPTTWGSRKKLSSMSNFIELHSNHKTPFYLCFMFRNFVGRQCLGATYQGQISLSGQVYLAPPSSLQYWLLQLKQLSVMLDRRRKEI